MMADNFGQKSLSVWNQLICQSKYCLKQKVLKFYVYLKQIMVSTMKNRDTWPPWGFKDVDHGQKQKAKINLFRKTAFIYHRFILFNSK